ncbi:MAG: hypothetical protein Fur003_2800 [Candidatus Dojkabacteria bacterium]
MEGNQTPTLEDKNYLKIAGNIHLSYFVEAADILGIKYEMIQPSVARFEANNKHWFIINTVTPLNNVPSKTVSLRKNLAYKVMNSAGIPVGIQKNLETAEEALAFFNEFNEIVIKPVQNLGGKGVTVKPQNESEVIAAFQSAYEKDNNRGKVRVLGEKFVHGLHYRLLVLEDKVIGAVHRKPASVTGDGISSIEELINQENERRNASMLMGIPIDFQTTQTLDSHGFKLGTVLNKGEEITVRANANLSTGGTLEECAAKFHPYYFEIAIKAVKALGLKYGGVDLIAEDITNPETGHAINEVNYNPGLRIHYKVDKGEVVKVAVPIMEYIRANL